MENIQWDHAKGEKLKNQRGISFEEIVICIENRQVLAIIENPGKKHKGQKVIVCALNNYIYYVPFVKHKKGIFLKTIIPSRKLTKKYMKGDEKNAQI
jgi:uncharacterized DUF497 family protein